MRDEYSCTASTQYYEPIENSSLTAKYKGYAVYYNGDSTVTTIYPIRLSTTFTYSTGRVGG